MHPGRDAWQPANVRTARYENVNRLAFPAAQSRLLGGRECRKRGGRTGVQPYETPLLGDRRRAVVQEHRPSEPLPSPRPDLGGQGRPRHPAGDQRRPGYADDVQILSSQPKDLHVIAIQ